MHSHIEEDSMPLSKIKTRDILLAAMNKNQAEKMKLKYKRSLGIPLSILNKEKHSKQLRKNQNEEMMQKYISKMKLSSFLQTYETKAYSLNFFNKLIMKYKKTESIMDYPHLRVIVGNSNQIWKALTRTDKNLKLFPKYYMSLLKSFDSAFKDFANVVDLDVRRTKAACESPSIYKKLTNVLLAFSKYFLIKKAKLKSGVLSRTQWLGVLLS